MIRDPRDVAASLLERGWLRAGREGRDDVGAPYGHHARFWVEPERRAEFEEASDARRAAWAWRRYVTAAREASYEDMLELRYEEVVRDPMATSAALAEHLDAPADAFGRALGRAHESSVGRFRHDLAGEQLADVIAEAGDLLRELGYLSSASA
jgi:hypothetical protein